MSLDGNLEDLGLAEVLQVISLSKKSGVLTLRSGEHEAEVVLRDGQVVRASSSMLLQSLGELLAKNAVITPVVLRKALALQQAEGFRERLGPILVKNFDVSEEAIEKVAKNRVAEVVLSLFGWTNGSFEFKTRDTVDTAYDTRLDPLQFMLNQGLNPHLLAMEGMKRQQIAKSDNLPPELSSELENIVHESETPPDDIRENVKKQLIIVDDDKPTLQAIETSMRDKGYDVCAMARSEEAFAQIDTMIRDGDSPTILADLIMPKMDGSGVLGGIELIELLRRNFKKLNMIIMSDFQHSEAEMKVLDMECVFILKPRRSDIAKEELFTPFIDKLTEEIGLLEQKADRTEEAVDEASQSDANNAEISSFSSVKYGTTDGASLLKSMLEELGSPDSWNSVFLSVLRFASEFLSRAVVFSVDDRVVRGVGQYGVCDGKAGHERILAITFSLDSDSMFSEPSKTLRVSTLKPSMTPVDSHIFTQLGGEVPTEVFIGPIVSNSTLIGFLYGDNTPENKPFREVEILETFLYQAGVVMERNLRIDA